MQKLFPLYAVSLMLLLLFQSCKKEESLTFDYHGEDIILYLEPNATTPTEFAKANTVPFDAESLATANKFPKEALKDITITDMEFTILNPDAVENFDLINTMFGSISTAQEPNPVEIFNTSKISSKTNDKIVVSGINQNIKDKVFNNKTFTFDFDGTLKNPLTKKIRIDVRFTYKVSLLGIKI